MGRRSVLFQIRGRGFSGPPGGACVRHCVRWPEVNSRATGECPLSCRWRVLVAADRASLLPFLPDIIGLLLPDYFLCVKSVSCRDPPSLNSGRRRTQTLAQTFPFLRSFRESQAVTSLIGSLQSRLLQPQPRRLFHSSCFLDPVRPSLDGAAARVAQQRPGGCCCVTLRQSSGLL